MNKSLSSKVKSHSSYKYFEADAIEQSIHSLFIKMADEYSQNIAITSDEYTVTYEKLNSWSDAIMKLIIDRCSGENKFIAIMLEHDAPMIASMLGVLKSGFGYIALEPSVPEGASIAKIQDSQAIAIVTDNVNSELSRKVSDGKIPIINIDNVEENVSVEPKDVSPDSYAYLLYTTGSTGSPKGSLQNHRNFLNFIRNYTNTAMISPDDRISVIASHSFSAAIMDIFGALLNGATACLWNLRKNGFSGMHLFISEKKITLYHASPTAFRHFCYSSENINYEHLRLIYLGGEGTTRKDFMLYKNIFSENTSLICSYGSTELGIITQFVGDKFSEVSDDYVPLGAPQENVRIKIVDENRNEVEDGEHGEIAIESPYLALGYWNKPEITNKQFVTIDGKRIFYSRDAAIKSPDGSFLYHGRLDSQINLHGYRIVLDELSMLICQLEEVENAVSIVRNDVYKEPCLVSYVKLSKGESLSVADIRKHLMKTLPEVMIPSLFVFLDQFPIVNNGKIDRKNLPLPIKIRDSKYFPKECMMPETTIEQELCEIWKKYINIDKVGIHDNFFEIGGTSLIAMEMVLEIQKKMNLKLPLSTLLESPDVFTMASYIEKRHKN